MGLVCVLAGLDMIVLTVWEFVDPLQIRFLNKTLEQVVSQNMPHGWDNLECN